MKYKNLYIIGTSHIAIESVNKVKDFFEKEKPTIVAVELDKNRTNSLMSTKQRKKPGFAELKQLGIKAFTILIIASYVENKLAKAVGTELGSDMITTINLAKSNNSRIFLIDQDIKITMQKLSKEITFKEKLTFVKEFFKSIIFRKKYLEKYGLKNLDLTKVPNEKVIYNMMNEVKLNYPNIYKVLIYERNIYMSKMLKQLIEKFPDDKILAVMGAGHENEIIEMIKNE